jgi:ATP-dependent DNA helicase DinG
VREERSALRGAPDGETPDQKARRERAAKALDSLAADIETVLAADDDHVTWVESSGAANQPALRVAPVDVGGELAKVLWSSATPILTSATIPPGISARLGLAGEATELDVGSPFDYRTQCLLYVPRLPDVRNPRHEDAAHEELEFLLTAAGGRTLALFTSWRAMRAAKAALDPKLPYTLLAQDDLPKPALIEQFRTDETSCLFATMGFWQGVDVPGDACSLVVIDRLPFARPDDPVAEARRERAGPAAFSVVDVPHAAIRLAQGAGRLIRSATDRGVVAVLDPRLAESSYRPAILAALPPMRRSRDRADVTAFFGAAAVR